ncbi:tRNA uridine-5-carboxymethylaminomethyl(34) synthesis GTPase MnmE [Streptococcus dysgalactiae subsp. dysgalactiae]|uniref:tRNA uridine-5-carboxymethylaminomethyl(34) synthesis GTPase MnmE n=1 Tax=Streptococcus dysgalactiae TaxID=1334 RepID=UPI0001AAB7FE|nr:tRNA uridine-5-carboxymethylaminomethyl(34) synthesis GTPase MnmE [Streptococcus dysgalactiae]QGH00296.1 tRNA uridine-5-carboxymethylaminomethyl(34) synthesis GTPase MnmE [Streptococcus dysgalactiae subsp. dysgalactiae]VTY28605.1 tRNA modification GTPase MnmE [Streptococcus dysgalactiae]BAH81690.1 tRNA(5-carboxymethylaminomethyl-2-thiouridylate)synthase [Streptococcus dysgalactiae subsp. equisimilis GGS_124]GET70568.1 tRNA modification GTPase MnmE [Streptococcus dysgalactiae subsp. equisimil
MSITKEFDTITAISTPLGEGAIGIVRLSGTDALAIAQSVFKGKNLEQVASHTINYGHIIDPKTGTIIDEVMVSVMLAPKTFTRENVVEINTHGGIAVTNEILQLLIRQGARMAEPGEFTKRAFLNGRVDLTQAEAVMDIIRAKTDKAMTIAVKQLDGSLSQLINDTRQEILNILAQVEVNIDYPEYDDVEEMTTALLREKTQEFQSLLENLLRTAKRGKILREGLSTAIIGRPNVGKSSLLNNLLREDKAIVTDIAGTTRDVIEEYVNIKGVPLKLVDTAGIRETDDLVEQIGVERSKKALQEADLVLLVLNASEKLTDQDRALLNLSQDSNRIILLNKTDLEQKIELEQLPDDYIPISVLTNQNINLIEDRINQLFFDNAGLVEQDATYLSNARHISLIEKAVQSLEAVNDGLALGMPVDLLQVDLTRTWEILGEITGDAAPDELITQLFSQFCLGK